MNCIGTYDGTIFYNPANKFCIISVKTADQSVPAEARSNRRYKDHLIRFTAVGYSSYVVVDPKGGTLDQCGRFLQREKYRVRVFNSIDFSKSMHYNPLAYARHEVA